MTRGEVRERLLSTAYQTGWEHGRQRERRLDQHFSATYIVVSFARRCGLGPFGIHDCTRPALAEYQRGYAEGAA